MRAVDFSFIMPVHNGMPFIRETVNSILNQTVRDFRLVILENRSDDGTDEYLSTLSDPRIEIVRSDRLLSVEENWARILELPKSKYFALAMADDGYERNYLEEIVRLIVRYGERCNVFRTNITAIDSEGKKVGYSKIRSRITIYDYLEGRLAHTYFETAAGYVFKTSAYDAIRGIDCRFKLMHTDDKLVMEMIGNGFMPVSPCFAARYRCHTGSISGSPDARAQIGGFALWMNWIHARSDKRLNRIVQLGLPLHMTQLTRFFGEDTFSEMRKVYPMFGINVEKPLVMRLRKLEKVFSVKNSIDGEKKVLTIFGHSLAFKRRKK